jgi:hypothetical protein
MKSLLGIKKTKESDINVKNLNNNDGLSNVDSKLKRVLHLRIN